MIFQHKNKINGGASAFTLVEALVTILIFSVIFGLITTFIVFSYRTQGYIDQQAKAVDEARRGVEVMVRDVRGAVTAANGAYPIERADDKQFVFYSDIDNDGKIERVRYFLGTVNAGSDTKECTISSAGGTCSVTFSNFLTGELKSAQVTISAKGDLDASNEYFGVSADGTDLSGTICQNGCSHCPVNWEGTTVFDVTNKAIDNSIIFLNDASSRVDRQCPVASPNYAMQARFMLSWSEEIIGLGNELKRGIIKPVGDPAEYPLDQEVVSIITPYIRNNPPIFKYYDSQGNEITDSVARLNDTKLIKVYLVINIDPNRPPDEFELESYVQLRNLKEE
jgi:type II secretory pathway pseudopilin PulG